MQARHGIKVPGCSQPCIIPSSSASRKQPHPLALWRRKLAMSCDPYHYVRDLEEWKDRELVGDPTDALLEFHDALVAAMQARVVAPSDLNSIVKKVHDRLLPGAARQHAALGASMREVVMQLMHQIANRPADEPCLSFWNTERLLRAWLDAWPSTSTVETVCAFARLAAGSPGAARLVIAVVDAFVAHSGRWDGQTRAELAYGLRAPIATLTPLLAGVHTAEVLRCWVGWLSLVSGNVARQVDLVAGVGDVLTFLLQHAACSVAAGDRSSTDMARALLDELRYQNHVAPTDEVARLAAGIAERVLMSGVILALHGADGVQTLSVQGLVVDLALSATRKYRPLEAGVRLGLLADAIASASVV